MSLKSRLLKLERNKKSPLKKIIVVLDGIIDFKDKKYTKKEFLKLNPHNIDYDFVEVKFE